MHIENFLNYCLSLPHAQEDFPFGPDNLVLKVGGKIFAITDLSLEDFRVNLKCDPEWAIELREKYYEIKSGYHMNKKHWNTVSFQGSLSDEFLKELINHSYERVYNGLTKKVKMELENLDLD